MSLALKMKVAIVVLSMVDTVLLVAAASVWLNNNRPAVCVDCSDAPATRAPSGVETFGGKPATTPPAKRTTSRPPSVKPSRIPPPSPTPKPSPKPTPTQKVTPSDSPKPAPTLDATPPSPASSNCYPRCPANDS